MSRNVKFVVNESVAQDSKLATWKLDSDHQDGILGYTRIQEFSIVKLEALLAIAKENKKSRSIIPSLLLSTSEETCLTDRKIKPRKNAK
jgi:hypothetical protein